MRALALLAAAEAAGVRVTADGAKLRLAAASPPPTDLLHALGGAKAEILALLAERQAEAEAAREERAAIAREPSLPPLGTPERGRFDREQQRMVAGLLRAARRPR